MSPIAARLFLPFLGAVVGLILLQSMPTRADEAEHFPQSLLFRIESDTGATSHLFGSMHSSAPAVLDVPSAAEQAFEAAEVAVFEVALDDATEIALAGSMLLPEGDSFQSRVGEDLAERAIAALEKRGIPGFLIDRLHVWAAAMLLSLPAEEYRRAAEGAEVLDAVLAERAREAGKTVVALETADEQLSALSGMSDEEQLLFLDYALATDAEDAWNSVQAAYLAADLAALWALWTDFGSQADEEDFFLVLHERLIVARNERMVERLLPILEAGGAFVTVGALHLPSEEGILEMLRQAGYGVTAID